MTDVYLNDFISVHVISKCEWLVIHKLQKSVLTLVKIETRIRSRQSEVFTGGV